MNHIVDSLLVSLASQQKLSQHGLLQNALCTVNLLAHQLLQTSLQAGIGAHEPLSLSIAVVNPDALFLQYPAHIALSATYTARYRYLHHDELL